MNETDWFLGVDGGGTKTAALLADGLGHVLGRGSAGPSNPNFTPPEQALAAVQTAAAEALRQAKSGLPAGSLRQAALCVPGLRRAFSRETFTPLLGIPAGQILITGDDWSTFYAALGQETGVVVLAGTGSFAQGRNERGQAVSLGGWGPLLGDAGSGYAIGLAAILAVVAAYEQRAAPTALTEAVLAHLAIAQVPELRARLYRGEHIHQEISALVPVVLQIAKEGDPAACAIWQKAGEDLADLALEVVEQLHFENNNPVVALTGGVSRAGNWILAPFEARLHQKYPAIGVAKPRFAPVVGAYWLALQAAGEQMTPAVLRCLEETSGGKDDTRRTLFYSTEAGS